MVAVPERIAGTVALSIALCCLWTPEGIVGAGEHFSALRSEAGEAQPFGEADRPQIHGRKASASPRLPGNVAPELVEGPAGVRHGQSGAPRY
jgi:hypothetical protein